MFGLIALLMFLSLALIGYAIATSVRGREAERASLDRRLETMTAATPRERGDVLRDRRLSAISVLNLLLERTGVARRFLGLVRQAGLRKRVGEVLLYIPLLGCIGFLLGMLLTGRFAFGLGGAAIGSWIPVAVLQRLRRKRGARFAEQLPDALDLIRAALQAGHSLVSALNVVASEFPDPMAQEIRDVAEEVRYGLPMRDAFYNLTQRVDDPNLPVLVVGVLVAQEVGGNMAEVLENVGYTIRERFKVLREVQVLTAQGKLSGRVLSGLPFLVGLAMATLNHTYFAPMLHTQAGHYLLLYALGSILFGHVIIRRLVHIQV
jgi:tight adherence protein B